MEDPSVTDDATAAGWLDLDRDVRRDGPSVWPVALAVALVVAARLVRRPGLRCLACRTRLDARTVALDLTGGNRAAAVYECHRCGSAMELRVPIPGGAVAPRLGSSAGGGAS